MNLEDQYDRIFKYLCFRLRDRNLAEDMTQEALLRFLESRTSWASGRWHASVCSAHERKRQLHPVPFKQHPVVQDFPGRTVCRNAAI